MTVTQPIVWPDELTAGTATEVAGAKMGRLAELAAAGVAVPQAFTVATEAFTAHLRAAGLDGGAPGLMPAPQDPMATRRRGRLQQAPSVLCETRLGPVSWIGEVVGPYEAAG